MSHRSWGNARHTIGAAVSAKDTRADQFSFQVKANGGVDALKFRGGFLTWGTSDIALQPHSINRDAA